MEKIEVTFYTKENCPLCDKAREVLRSLEKEQPLSITAVDIYTDDTLLEKYQLRIPVVEVAGKVIAEGIVTETEVRRGLSLVESE